MDCSRFILVFSFAWYDSGCMCGLGWCFSTAPCTWQLLCSVLVLPEECGGEFFWRRLLDLFPYSALLGSTVASCSCPSTEALRVLTHFLCDGDLVSHSSLLGSGMHGWSCWSGCCSRRVLRSSLLGSGMHGWSCWCGLFTCLLRSLLSSSGHDARITAGMNQKDSFAAWVCWLRCCRLAADARHSGRYGQEGQLCSAQACVRARRRFWQWHVHGWFAGYVAPRDVFP